MKFGHALSGVPEDICGITSTRTPTLRMEGGVDTTQFADDIADEDFGIAEQR